MFRRFCCKESDELILLGLSEKEEEKKCGKGNCLEDYAVREKNAVSFDLSSVKRHKEKALVVKILTLWGRGRKEGP